MSRPRIQRYLAIFLLKGARPQKYRDNVRQEVTGADGVPLGARKVDIVIVPTPDIPPQ
jgi:hypothetical protein